MAGRQGSFQFNQRTLDAYMAGRYGVDAEVKHHAERVLEAAHSTAGIVVTSRIIADYDAPAGDPSRTFADYPSTLFIERSTHNAVSERQVKNGGTRLAYIVGSNWTRPWVTRLPSGSGNTGSLWVESLFSPLTRALGSCLTSGKIRLSSRSRTARESRIARRR